MIEFYFLNKLTILEKEKSQIQQQQQKGEDDQMLVVIGAVYGNCDGSRAKFRMSDSLPMCWCIDYLLSFKPYSCAYRPKRNSNIVN